MASKNDVQAALKDPNAAFKRFIEGQEQTIQSVKVAGGRLPAYLAVLDQEVQLGAAARTNRRRIFKANLRRIAKLNADSGPDLAFNMTEFTALAPKEFAALYLTNVTPDFNFSMFNGTGAGRVGTGAVRPQWAASVLYLSWPWPPFSLYTHMPSPYVVRTHARARCRRASAWTARWRWPPQAVAINELREQFRPVL